MFSSVVRSQVGWSSQVTTPTGLMIRNSESLNRVSETGSTHWLGRGDQMDPITQKPTYTQTLQRKQHCLRQKTYQHQIKQGEP